MLRKLVNVLLAMTFVMAGAVNANDSSSADLILTNAKVYTLSWPEPDGSGHPHSDAPYQKGQWRPDASTVVIRNQRIIAVGSERLVEQWRGKLTDVRDLNGATVIPGLVDSHVHIAELGEILSRINLMDVTTPQEAIGRIKQTKPAMQAGHWIIGQGWDEGAWADNYPSRQLLDKHFPDNPVVLKSLHGFAVWTNSKALEVIGIDRSTAEPSGGKILKDNTGKPTGIFLNRATPLILEAIPEPSEQEWENWILKGLQQMSKDGFVAIHQAGATERHIRAFQSLQAKGQLPIRVYAMLSAREPALADHWMKQGPLVDNDGWLDVRSVKAYYDGALGSRGARLLSDYSDKPGHQGVSGSGYGFDYERVTQLMHAGFQVGIHAIGDAGNREVLNFIEKVYKSNPNAASLRHRIEHAQVIHPNDFERFKQLELVASMEPPHAVEDKDWAETRIGTDRIKGAYAWRRLRQLGVPITFNSDLPGSDHRIGYGLHAAVNRQDKQFNPAEGWYRDQALTIEESIRSYTQVAAYAAFREDESGDISAGKWADLTVLNNDPFTQQASELIKNQPRMTIVAGKIVYEQWNQEN